MLCYEGVLEWPMRLPIQAVGLTDIAGRGGLNGRGLSEVEEEGRSTQEGGGSPGCAAAGHEGRAGGLEATQRFGGTAEGEGMLPSNATAAA